MKIIVTIEASKPISSYELLRTLHRCGTRLYGEGHDAKDGPLHQNYPPMPVSVGDKGGEADAQTVTVSVTTEA